MSNSAAVFPCDAGKHERKAYANAHRIPAEEEKPAAERGRYLHPAELGQPAELGLDYQDSLHGKP